MQIGTLSRLGAKALRRSFTEALFFRSRINFTRPSDIKATLTERCNYRCVYCAHWRQKHYTDEMPLEAWKHALRSLKDFTPGYAVQFIGGEPMIVPWFFDLVSFCHEERIDWGVITNGSSLSEARVQDIVAAKPLNIDVSIDSALSAEHDSLRGVAGSLGKVRAGVERLVAERTRTHSRFLIRLKPTVTRQTMTSLPNLVDWAETQDGVFVDFSPVRLWRQSDIQALYPATPEELRQLEAVVGILIRRKVAGAPIETSADKLLAMIDHFSCRPNSHGVGRCRVGLRSLDIRPNGDVIHCWNFNRIGNVREASIADIWESAERRAMIEQTVACDLFKTTCSTSCHAHRTLRQEIARGIRYLRS